MAKTPATVIAEINQYIVANGVGAISGPILNGVLQDLCDLVPPTPLDNGLMGYDSSGNPLAVSGGSGGTPGGTSGQLQYNNSGSFGGYGVGSGLSVVGGNLTANAAASGMQVVTSVAALQAIIGGAGQAVYLDSGGRSGIFAWQVGDYSAEGTNDPGQGEWVVPTIYAATFVVSGTINPNLVGTYTLAGSYNGRPYYTSPGIGVIWSFHAGPDWIIGSHLGASEASFFQGSGAVTPPTGSYPNNGIGGATGTATLALGTPTAGAGAWQRQWSGTSDWAWWGAVADCVRTLDLGTWLPTIPSQSSSSTVTAGVGSLNFVVATGLTITTGGGVFAVASGISISGTVTSYNSGTGALVINATSFTGSSASSSWSIFFMTNNGPAFLDWQTWAQYKTSQGIGVKVSPSFGITGVYGWSQATTGSYWTFGIAGTGGIDLHLDGRGAIGMQQFDAGAANTSFPIANSQALTQANSFLINNTTIGATSFTCTTVAQASHFTKGMTVLLMSLDTQYLGYPPNAQNYEYRLITANGNTSTGVVTCDAIECAHLSTYPDFEYGGGLNVGAARAWLLGPNWDATHIYEGLIVGLAPTATVNTYVQFSIRKTITKDWVGPGFSETIAQEVIHIRAKFKTFGETDKLVERITYYSPDTTISLGCQSTCPKQYNMIGGRLGSLTGWGQNLFASGVTFNGAVTPTCDYGFSYGGIFENCRIVGGGLVGGVIDGAGFGLTIDGTNAAYANGVITLNLSALAGSGLLTQWNLVPGVILMLIGTASDTSTLEFTGDYCALLVFSLTADSTNMYVNTNGPATLPTWATGTIVPLKVGPVTFRNCSGPDSIRNASSATDNTQPYYQWIHNVIMGNTANPYATSLEFSINGLFTSFECDVVIPHPTSGATLSITFRAYTISPTAITADYVTIVINSGVAGKRTINTIAFTGAAGTDSVTIGSGGASVQPLPINHQLLIAIGAVTAAGATSPLIKTIIQTDCGISRKQIPPQNFGVHALISSVVLPMQGQQQ